MLDVDMLLPAEAPAAVAGYFAMTFRNRGDLPCSLSLTGLTYLEGGKAEPLPYARGSDTSAAAVSFRAQHGLLNPGDLAHLTLAWSAVPTLYNDEPVGGCSSFDSIRLGLESMGAYSNASAFVEVRHLWLRSCDGVWVSQMRAGPVLAEEPIPGEWLDLHKIKREALTSPPAVHEGAGAKSGSIRALREIEYLKSTFESGYSEFVLLILNEDPAALASCPFRSLRRREADGETTIYINHCESVGRRATEIHDTRQELLLRDYDLLPRRTGRVEYKVVGKVAEGDALWNSETSMIVRDPTLPMLPVIATAVSECNASQLTADPAPFDLGTHWSRSPDYARPGEGRWQDARAFQFTNTSPTTCRIGGLPKTHFNIVGAKPPNPHWAGDICRNCATSLFQPRDSEWINLKPSESAHFLVGVTGFEQRFWNLCTTLESMDLNVGGTDLPSMPFLTLDCGQIAVSAWRAGAYDQDPMNVAYARTGAQRPQEIEAANRPVPVDCAKRVSAETGRPVMFSSTAKLEWGLATRPATYSEGVPVTVWIHNPSDKPVQLFTCSDVENHLWGAFDLVDPSGHLVLTKEQAAAAQAGKPIQSRPHGVMACNSNVLFPIAPHSCLSGSLTRSSPFFTMDLAAVFAVAPGTYYLVPPLPSSDGMFPPLSFEPRTMPPPGPALRVTVLPD